VTVVFCILQVSNLKKIVQGIVDYYQECLNQHLTDFSRPDVVKIGNMPFMSCALLSLHVPLFCCYTELW
jgi:protein HOOK3